MGSTISTFGGGGGGRAGQAVGGVVRLSEVPGKAAAPQCPCGLRGLGPSKTAQAAGQRARRRSASLPGARPAWWRPALPSGRSTGQTPRSGSCMAAAGAAGPLSVQPLGMLTATFEKVPGSRGAPGRQHRATGLQQPGHAIVAEHIDGLFLRPCMRQGMRQGRWRTSARCRVEIAAGGSGGGKQGAAVGAGDGRHDDIIRLKVLIAVGQSLPSGQNVAPCNIV
jgi:hypothetical protein